MDLVNRSDPSPRHAEPVHAVRGPLSGLGNRPDPSSRYAAPVEAAG